MSSVREWAPDRRRFGYRSARNLSALVVVMIVLGACGDDDESAATSVASTSVGAVIESVPTPESSVATTESGTVDPSTTSATEPSVGAPTTEQPVVGTTPSDPTIGGWQFIADRQAPELPGNKSAPILSPLPDGVYWSWSYESNGNTVDFTLSQYFFGDACREQFGDGDVVCASENETLYEPSATVAMSAGTGAATVVAYSANGTFNNDAYSVSSAEFARLVAGMAPASDAPPGFTFQSFAVIVTVRDGQVVAADQVFTS